ncbi:transcriptional regulator GcvA [Roseibium salinum]|uniref:Transcriptional regulator GcvA n=1 Tax=Roseibium salinum TaxID=1604349 RepID=A0ABT3R9C9_9HYPH|nr:transcriptional regulator GcvA [Roseibium sp. DSM 29163]MCX2725729.1 transcriptional regulator GcvA [Roseibium sp. DSM 29163]
MLQLPPLTSLRAFESAARHLSFKRAADELGVTPTAISHQIRLLEETLGGKLFERQPRKVALTEIGLQLYPVCREAFSSMSDAVAAVMGKTQQRAVTVTSTTAFSAGWLVPRIGRFTAANPGITLRIHPCETVVDLQRGVADCAIRYGGAPFAGLVAEPLFDDSFAPICSPGLNIRMPEDLKHHTLLHSEWRLQNEFTPSWRKWCKIAGVRDVDTRAGTVLTDESHVIQATIAGQGIALLSTVLVQDELRRGLLVQPFGPALEGLGYHFVFPKTATGNPGIRAVRDWLFSETNTGA